MKQRNSKNINHDAMEQAAEALAQIFVAQIDEIKSQNDKKEEA